MQDPLVYTGLQSQILHAQSKAEKRAASNRPQLVLSDRCGLDPLAYNAWRFGMDSAQVMLIALKLSFVGYSISVLKTYVTLLSNNLYFTLSGVNCMFDQARAYALRFIKGTWGCMKHSLMGAGENPGEVFHCPRAAVILPV